MSGCPAEREQEQERRHRREVQQEAGRNRTLGLKALAAIAVPLPPRATQETFCHMEAMASSAQAVHVGPTVGLELGEFRVAALQQAFAGLATARIPKSHELPETRA